MPGPYGGEEAGDVYADPGGQGITNDLPRLLLLFRRDR